MAEGSYQHRVRPVHFSVVFEEEAAAQPCSPADAVLMAPIESEALQEKEKVNIKRTWE